MARSVARRSTLEAPKKPAIPSVFSKMYCTSSGSAIGPPWHSTITSSRIPLATSCISCIRLADSSRVGATSALTPIEPLTVVFIWATNTRSEEHTSELQSRGHLVCRLLLEKKKESKKIDDDAYTA